MPAATWSSVWYLLSAFAVISYTRNWVYVCFAALGSWIGAYASMTLLRRTAQPQTRMADRFRTCHNPKVRILISAGEASGEFYGAELMKALRQQALRARVRMLRSSSSASAESRCARLAASCWPTLARSPKSASSKSSSTFPRIYRRFRQVVREAERRRPDAAVLIDFPDFNLRLARELHKRGVPVIYYVSPQLWAWKQGRIELVRKYVRKMLVIFPFEEKFYREHGIEARVRRTSAGRLASCPPSRAINSPPNTILTPARQWIALLPGSRRAEVSRIFPSCWKQRNFWARITFT